MTAPGLQRRRPVAAFAAPAGLLLLTIAFYWKLALTDQYIWFDHPDMVYIELPRLQFQASQMHRGRFPLWDPNIWCGQPLIGQTQPGPLFPPNVVFGLLPLQDGYIRAQHLNWYYTALHFLAALFCYLLARELGAGYAGAVLAGCVFSFGGFLGTVPWLDVLNGAICTPLIALFFVRAVRRPRAAANAALCGMFVGLAWLSGHHEIPLLVSAALAGSWAIYAWHNRRAIGLAALCFAIAGLVSAAQLWPTLEFGRLSHRWVGAAEPAGWQDRVPYTIHSIYSLPPRGLLDTLLPGGTDVADVSPFLGAMAVALAACGLVTGWSSRPVRYLALAAATSLLYAFGALTPLHGVIYSLAPGLEKARIPVRAIHIYNLAMALLAARGLGAVLAGDSAVWSRRLALALAGLGALLLAGLYAGTLFGHAGEERMWLAGICALAAAGSLSAYRRGLLGKAATVSAVFLVTALELTALSTRRFPHRTEGGQIKFARQFDLNRDIAAYLRGQPGEVRVAVNEPDIPLNFGDWHGIEMLQGYLAGVPQNLTGIELHTPRVQRLFGVTHWVGKEPQRPDQVPVFEGATGVKVYRNPDPLPRVWLVHEVSSAKDHDALRLLIQNESFDLRRRAALTGTAPQLEQCSGADSVAIDGRTTDRVIVRATTACRALLIVGDSYFPGWKATIDGKPAEVLEVNGAQRGVVVEAGTHRVEMVYRPLSNLGGAALTLAGLLLTLGVCLASRPASASRAARRWA